MKMSNKVRPTLLYMSPETVIPAKAGIQIENTGFRVKPGMTIKVKGLLTQYTNLMNSRGISVLFLVIAMMLMVAIGYVFSYLIPMKQKTVKFPIYSTQAFFIAQSGVEFAIRYASNQGWRGATDNGVFDLTRLNSIGAKSLGNGTFTVNYDQPSDVLTSTGQITGSSENRVVRLSSFTPFLRLIFDPSSNMPCWCLGTRRARFYIRDVRYNPAGVNPLILTSFSASWNYTGTARTITRIDMNGTQKYSGAYVNGATPVNLNRPILTPTQTITSGMLVNILVYWSGNITNCTNLQIIFYTGALGTRESYPFDLDSAGNGLNGTALCGAGC